MLQVTHLINFSYDCTKDNKISLLGLLCHFGCSSEKRCPQIAITSKIISKKFAFG